MRGRPTTIRNEDLLDAARETFLVDGHAATTAAIAKRAGVAEGTLYRRYKTKDALLAAVIAREIEPPVALAEACATASKRSVQANLTLIIEILMGAVARAHVFIELAETSPHSSGIRRRVLQQGTPPPQRIVEQIARYLDAEIASGRIRRVYTLACARAMFGGCIDFTRSRQFAGRRETAKAFTAGLIDLLMQGMANP